MLATILQIHLFIYLLIVSWLLIFWQLAKDIRWGIFFHSDDNEHQTIKRIKSARKFYWVLFVLYAVIITVFSFYNNGYSIFIPIESLNHNAVNFCGLIILKLAFIFFVCSHIHINVDHKKITKQVSSHESIQRLLKSERLTLLSKLFMFVGLFVTLSNMASLIITFIAIMVYLRVIISDIRTKK